MAQAFIMVAHDGTTVRYPIDLTLPPEFAGAKYVRLRAIETRRLLEVGISSIFESFNADRPLTNETLIMISFEGLPIPEPKKES